MNVEWQTFVTDAKSCWIQQASIILLVFTERNFWLFSEQILLEMINKRLKLWKICYKKKSKYKYFYIFPRKDLSNWLARISKNSIDIFNEFHAGMCTQIFKVYWLQYILLNYFFEWIFFKCHFSLSHLS